MDNSVGIKLKRCPFCGKRKATTIVNQFELKDCPEPDEDVIKRYTVVCDHDKGGCGATCGFRSSREVAALFWNTRW